MKRRDLFKMVGSLAAAIVATPLAKHFSTSRAADTRPPLTISRIDPLKAPPLFPTESFEVPSGWRANMPYLKEWEGNNG